jgi:hypothetical protein
VAQLIEAQPRRYIAGRWWTSVATWWGEATDEPAVSLMFGSRVRSPHLAAALSASGSLPENVNYAVKSGYLLSFLESVPDVAAKLKEANAQEIKFEEVVEKAKQAAVLVLVY